MAAQPIVRSVAGSVWTKDPYVVQARHMAGSVWTLDALALPTAKGSAALLALINANTPAAFTATNLTIGAPSTSTQNGKNTQVLVTALKASGYSGSMTLYYNRRTIAAAFASTQWLLGTIASATTILAQLNAINTAYGTNFDPTDIVDGPIAAGATSLQLTVKTGSYVFLPGSQVFLQNTVALSAALPVVQLGGFTDANNANGPSLNYTSALLHFDSPAGLTQITDDYGHAVTLGSAAALSTTVTKFGLSSLVGTGTTTQYVSLADSPDLRLGGDFTIEFWFYMNTLSQDCGVVSKGASGNANQAWIEFLNGNIQVKPDGAATASIIAGAGLYAASTWTHFALTKQGTLWTAWINGTPVGTLTSAAGFGNLPGPLSIMGSSFGSNSLNGYIDEFRYTNGLARYSANFTPPTAQFPTDASDALLMHLDSVDGKALVDETGTYTPTLVGSAALVTTGQKFGAGAVNVPNDATSGIMIPDAPGLRFTGDFCIEMMIFPTNSAVNANLVGKGAKALLWLAAGGRFQLTLDGSSVASINTVLAGFTYNAWHHVALTREVNIWRIWVDGAVVGSVTTAGSFGNVANNLYFGNGPDQSGWGQTVTGLAGLVDEVRVTNGWCRYTPNANLQVAPYVKDGNGGTLAQAFAGKTTLSLPRPATARSVRALTSYISRAAGINLQAGDVMHAIAAAGTASVTLTAGPSGLNYKAGSTVTLQLLATALLVHFDGNNGSTSASDVITGQALSMTGGAALSNVQSRFGGSSFLPNSAGAATLPDHPFYRLTGDYTIEFFSYMNAVPAGSQIPYAKNPTGSSIGPFLTLGASGSLYVFDDQTVNGNIGNQTLLTATGLIKANQWQHVAVVVKNGVLTAYIDGVAAGTVNVIGHTFGNNANPILFGTYTTAGFTVNGYLDEFRISNVARYSGNFTPPQQPFLATDAMTVLSSVFPTTIPTVVVPTGVTTIKGLANTIAKTCGVNLTADDLVDGPLSGNSVTITVAPTSYVYVPGGQVTIPTSAASAVLLMHFDGTQGQTSTADEVGHPMTMAGSSLTTTNKKFGTTAYQGSASGYVSTPFSTDLQFPGDFTMEAFWTPTAADLAGESMLFSSSLGSFLDCFKNAWYTSHGSTNVKVINGVAANLVAGTTYHVAYTRQGTLTTIWVNGQSVATGNTALLFGDGVSGFVVGNYISTPSIGTAGQLDEVRITKGVSRYNAAFTPPQHAFPLALNGTTLAQEFGANTTATIVPPGGATTIRALVAQIALSCGVNLTQDDVVDGSVAAGATSLTLTVASTSLTYVVGSTVNLTLRNYTSSLLVHADTAATADATGKKLTYNGNGVVGATQVKIGAGAYSPGTTGYISTPSDPTFPNTGAWTFEAWVYRSSALADTTIFSSKTANTTTGQLTIGQSTAVGLGVYLRDGKAWQVLATAAQFPLSQWNHIAVTYDGTSTYTGFINGVQTGTVVSAGLAFVLPGDTLTIGGNQFNTASQFPGYIDELRLSNGVRYTSTFVPPPQAFPTFTQSVPLASAFTSTGVHMAVGANTTILALLNQIASLAGVNLLANDVVDGPVLAGASSVTLTAASTSLLYVPGTTVTLSLTGSTLALLHMDGTNGSKTVTDDMGHTVNVAGAGALSTTQVKFGTAAYNPNTTGNLSVVDPGNMATPGDFTLEMQVYFASTPTTAFLANRNTNGGTQTAVLIISGNLTIGMDDSSAPLPLASSTLPPGQWNHLAYVKKGTTLQVFINGVLRGTASTNASWGNNNNPLVIGSNGLGGNALAGYFDEVRYSAVARYSATFTPQQQVWLAQDQSIAIAAPFASTAVAFTPPASATTISALINQIASLAQVNLLATDIVDGPVAAGATSVTLTASANSYTYTPGSTVTLTVPKTLLLLHMDGTNQSQSMPDASGNRVMTASGGTVADNSLSTAQAKFGTASYLSSGAGGFVTPSTSNLQLGVTGDFTIEFFFYMISAVAGQVMINKSTGGARIQYNAGKLYVYSDQSANTDGGQLLTVPASFIKTAQWQHIAIVKAAGVWTAYVDGVAQNSVSAPTQTFGNNATQLLVGNYYSGANPQNGYMDELRISNMARYTSNFTPPTVPFVTD